MSLTLLLQRLQSSARHLFSIHGRWCARHQIPALLTICVVSCLLFYPALDLYFWTASSSLSNGGDGIGTRGGGGEAEGRGASVRTSLRSGGVWRRRLRARERAYADLAIPWDGQPGYAVCEDDKCWDRCPLEDPQTVVRLLRVLLTSEEVTASREGHVHIHEAEHGSLSLRTLHRALRLEKDLESRLRALQKDSASGVKRVGSPISVFGLWNHSEIALLNDTGIDTTIDLATAATALDLGTPTFRSLLAGRRWSPTEGGTTHHLHRADFLALHFPVWTSTDDGAKLARAWSNMVNRALGSSGSSVERSSAHRRKMLLRRPPPSSTSLLPSTPTPAPAPASSSDDTLLFALAYYIVGMYVYLTLRKLDQVHSRTGLVFTGLVEVAVSGVLSLSVCALFGIEFDLVPWKLLPFVVAVLGVDNMLLLANAVVRTSIDLPVSERIAQGLGSVGFSITVSLLAEISAIFCVILIVRGGPDESLSMVSKELSIFSIVALVVEYFLELTFFLTVLSIDLQRLELADLLRQQGSTSKSDAFGNGKLNGGLVGGAPPRTRSRAKTTAQQASFVTTFGAIYQATIEGIKARAARVATFNVLFMFFFFMWLNRPPERYLPTFCADLVTAAASSPSSAPTLPPDDAAGSLWSLLNPSNRALLPVIVEPPLIATFSAAFPLPAPSALTGALFRGIRWTFKVVVFPISTTTIALYFVLVFLLKDADKLEAQRNKDATAAGLLSGAESEGEGAQVVMEMLLSKPVLGTDVDLVATNGVHVFVISSIENELVRLRVDSDRGRVTHDGHRKSSVVPLPQGKVATALATSRSGERCAVGCSDGTVLLIANAGGAPMVLPTREESSIKHVAFRTTATGATAVLAVSATGAVYSGTTALQAVVAPSKDTRKSCLFLPDEQQRDPFALEATVCCRLLASGSIEIWRELDTESSAPWHLTAMAEVPLGAGRPMALLAFTTELRGATCEVLAVGTSTGKVVLCDLSTGSYGTSIASLGTSIRQIAVLPSTGESSRDGCFLVAGTSSCVRVLRVAGAPDPSSQSAFKDGVQANGGSPKLLRSLSASYRASPRLRRVSAGRVSDENLSGSSAFVVPSFAVSHLGGSADVSSTLDSVFDEAGANGGPTLSAPPSPSPNSMRKLSLPSLSAEVLDSSKARLIPPVYADAVGDDISLDGRGGWAAFGGKLVGLRRAVRARSPPRGPKPPSPIVGWEVWQFDTAASHRHLTCGALGDIIDGDGSPGSTSTPPSEEDSRPNPALRSLLRASHAESIPIPNGPAALPFSRIRPIVRSTGDDLVLAVGLANVVGIILPKESVPSSSCRSNGIASSPFSGGSATARASRSRSSSTLPPPKATPRKSL